MSLFSAGMLLILMVNLGLALHGKGSTSCSTSLAALLNSPTRRALVAALHPGVVAERAGILVAAPVFTGVKAVFRFVANGAHRAFAVLVVPFLPRPCYRFF